MLLSSIICSYNIPLSSNDSDALDSEFYLVWVSQTGAVNHWLFNSYNQIQELKGEVINTKNNPQKIINEAKNIVELIAEDLTENEFDVISAVTRCQIARRYFKDGTYTPLAIVDNSFEKTMQNGRYVFKFKVNLKDYEVCN